MPYRLSALLGLLLLTACAAPPERPVLDQAAEAQAWRQQQARLSALAQWAFSARIALSTEDDAWSGRLRWRQEGAHFLIEFEGPFGQGAMRLQSVAEEVELRLADGERHVAADAGSLLADFLGARLPVDGLRYWVRGLPQPGTAVAFLALDGQGRLARLRQNGWDIRYSAYRRYGDLDLPRKIRIEGGGFDLRLVIDRWQIEG